MTDQQRFDCLGANGNSIIKTPNLDKLAKRSANFSHTFVQSPVCTPSRACFFSGRYAHAHKNRVNYTELNESETLLPKYLQDAGYQTSLVGKTHLYYKYPPTKKEAQRTGFDFVDLPKRENREDILKLPPHVHKLILRNEHRGREPHFKMDKETLQWIYRSYYATVSHVDHEVGRILQTLEETGQAENTVVVFTSDHGDQLLEHGLVDKNVFFESSVCVPFMISYPEKVNAGRYDDLVESIDLLPTLFEMLGLEEPYHNHGQSLLPLIGDSEKAYHAKECVFSENVIPEVFLNLYNFEKGKGVMDVRHPGGKMVRTERWKYKYSLDRHQLTGVDV
jgi:arylsulfatase A-like enzyme